VWGTVCDVYSGICYISKRPFVWEIWPFQCNIHVVLHLRAYFLKATSAITWLQETRILTQSAQEIPRYFQEGYFILKSTWAQKMPHTSLLSTARTLEHWYIIYPTLHSNDNLVCCLSYGSRELATRLGVNFYITWADDAYSSSVPQIL
jgi:hypothetical protein